MASLIYNSLMTDIIEGNVDFGADTFYAMLVTSSYTPNKDTHSKRSDVTNEVSGTGYTAGGSETAVTVAAIDTDNDDLEISFGSVTFTSANSFTSAGAVIYKSRGGASSADELVAFVDFGTPVAAVGADYVVSFTSPLKLQN